jgi:hypothetical protein
MLQVKRLTHPQKKRQNSKRLKFFDKIKKPFAYYFAYVIVLPIVLILIILKFIFYDMYIRLNDWDIK